MVPYFKGTDKAEEALYIQAECYFGQKDYEMSAHYFRQLAKMYPGSSYVEDCYYMEALSYYKSSPKPVITSYSIHYTKLYDRVTSGLAKPANLGQSGGGILKAQGLQ